MARKQGTAGKCALALASVAALVVCVAGCHGGGDTPGPSNTAGQQFVVTPANVSFAAASTGVGTPPARSVMATVTGPTGGTLFARLVVTGDAVDVGNSSVQVLNANQARITIRPVPPLTAGVGNHASVITLIACNTDPSCSGAQIGGSPATINVAYTVDTVTTPPAPPQSLAPSVGAANVAGDVVLRGSGFLPVTSVAFGGTPAADFTVMSDTEIRATYPALAAGVNNISLNGGAVPFGPSLTLVAKGTLVAAQLTYPTPPQTMRGLAFDPVTQTLFVGAGFSTPINNQVVGFTFSGGVWQAVPPPVTVQNLRNLTLSFDRAHLLALTDTQVVDLNPSTLVAQATTLWTTNGNTAADAFLKGIVATNDGQAFIVSSSPTTTGQHWLYDVAARAFSNPSIPPNLYSFPQIGGPDNGTRAVLVQGSVPQPIQQYNAFTGLVTATSFSLTYSHPVTAGRVENINLPAFDRNGNRMLVAGFNGGTFHAVYDANFDELGRVPSSDLVGGVVANTAAYAITPDATRAYILQIGAGVCRVRAFDLRTPPGPGVQYQEVTVTGFPINLSPNCPATDFTTPSRMLLDPTGTVLFIAGERLIRIVTPLP